MFFYRKVPISINKYNNQIPFSIQEIPILIMMIHTLKIKCRYFHSRQAKVKKDVYLYKHLHRLILEKSADEFSQEIKKSGKVSYLNLF